MIEVNGSNGGIFSSIIASLLLVSIELAYSLLLAVIILFFILFLIKLSIITENTVLEWLIGFSLIIIAVLLTYHLSVILTMFIWGFLLKIVQNNQDYVILQSKTRKLDVLAVPILLLFFILIGLSMEITILLQTGTLVIAGLYFFFRLLGKGIGSYVTSYTSGISSVITNYLPFSLLTQAGVAIGLAGLAYKSLTTLGRVADANLVINIVGISVILSELLGPFFLKFAINKSGEGRYKTRITELTFD